MGQHSIGSGRVIALDSNILVRLLIRDDPEQLQRARQVSEGDSFIPLTVILETLWVMTRSYRIPAREAAAELKNLLAVSNFHMEAPRLTEWALDRFADGADAGDVIHLVASRDSEAFATFDRKMGRQAGPETPVRILAIG